MAYITRLLIQCTYPWLREDRPWTYAIFDYCRPRSCCLPNCLSASVSCRLLTWVTGPCPASWGFPRCGTTESSPLSCSDRSPCALLSRHRFRFPMWMSSISVIMYTKKKLTPSHLHIIENIATHNMYSPVICLCVWHMCMVYLRNSVPCFSCRICPTTWTTCCFRSVLGFCSEMMSSYFRTHDSLVCSAENKWKIRNNIRSVSYRLIIYLYKD